MRQGRIPTELYNGAKMRDLIPRKERDVLKKLPSDLQRQVLEIANRYGAESKRRSGRAVTGWVRALHIRQAIERVLDPHAGQRRAGQKSWRMRLARDPQGAMLHMRLISRAGVNVRRFQRKTGRRYKAGWLTVDGNPAPPVQPGYGPPRSGWGGLKGI